MGAEIDRHEDRKPPRAHPFGQSDLRRHIEARQHHDPCSARKQARDNQKRRVNRLQVRKTDAGRRAGSLLWEFNGTEDQPVGGMNSPQGGEGRAVLAERDLGLLSPSAFRKASQDETGNRTALFPASV